MKNYHVRQYTSEDFAIWNAFISTAKNATFLFHRDFMEYHQDRFQDFSLLVFQDDKLISVLPANRVEAAIFSHQGLTYGGFVFVSNIKVEIIKGVFHSVIDFLKGNNIKTFIIKQFPNFYFSSEHSEIEYFFIKNGANLIERDMNLAINLTLPLTISKSKLKHYNKSKTEQLVFVEERTCNSFWHKVLEPRLKEKYSVNPVHSLSEINNLKTKFPENILQFSAYFESEIVAGITIFDKGSIVKSQYGATTEKGEKLRALDFLFITLIKKYKAEGKLFFDMGIVHKNKGLQNQKEELGCSHFVQDHYKIELDD